MPRKVGIVRAVAALLASFVVLAGCVSKAPLASQDEGAYLPRTFGVFIGGPMSASFRVSLESGRLRYVARGADRSVKADTLIDPSPAQWKAFWQKLDSIGFWTWKAEYPNPNVVDGTWWGVDIRYGGRSVASKGDNNYPQGGGSNNDPEPSPDFQKFLSAVQDLIGGLYFR